MCVGDWNMIIRPVQLISHRLCVWQRCAHTAQQHFEPSILVPVYAIELTHVLQRQRWPHGRHNRYDATVNLQNAHISK